MPTRKTYICFVHNKAVHSKRACCVEPAMLRGAVHGGCS